jgi:hypothetical protein
MSSQTRISRLWAALYLPQAVQVLEIHLQEAVPLLHQSHQQLLLLLSLLLHSLAQHLPATPSRAALTTQQPATPSLQLPTPKQQEQLLHLEQGRRTSGGMLLFWCCPCHGLAA